MFEFEQAEVAELLRSNTQFRELYKQHESLDQEVDEDASGIHPLGDETLRRLKRRKLLIKDQMASMIHRYHMANS